MESDFPHLLLCDLISETKWLYHINNIAYLTPCNNPPNHETLKGCHESLIFLASSQAKSLNRSEKRAKLQCLLTWITPPLPLTSFVLRHGYDLFSTTVFLLYIKISLLHIFFYLIQFDFLSELIVSRSSIMEWLSRYDITHESNSVFSYLCNLWKYRTQDDLIFKI